MHNPIIFFGDKKCATRPVTRPGELSMADEPFATLKRAQGFNEILFPYQVHGTAGMVIDADAVNALEPFTHEADWIITNLSGVGVGILTADCVPILLYDPVNKAIGAVHAGWRGAVEGVVVKALESMRIAFGTQAHDLHAWIGPHARACCYRVDEQFHDIVMQKKYGKAAWHCTDNLLFFDLSACCREQLMQAGVQMIQVTDTNICTICDPSYCSYRREKEAAKRNIAIIGLSTISVS